MSRRENLKKEQPSLNHREIISKMSEEWNKLPTTQKEPYVKQAEKDKIRFETEMKAYLKNVQATYSEPKKDKKSAAPASNGKSKKNSKKKESSEEEDDDEEEDAYEMEEEEGDDDDDDNSD